jgi:hypothetical protein
MSTTGGGKEAWGWTENLVITPVSPQVTQALETENYHAQRKAKFSGNNLIRRFRYSRA